MSADTDTIVGVILAGGLARRMGGGDKCLIPIGGRPMLQHVIDRLKPQVSGLVVNANGDPGRFASLELTIVPDTIDGFAGPLAGVLAGMRWAAETVPGAAHVLSVAGDTPFFPEDLAPRLSNAVSGLQSGIGLAETDGRTHPVFGLWPVALAADLDLWLQDSANRKVLHFVDRYPFRIVPFDDAAAPAGLDPFFNVNQPDDLARAEASLEEAAE